MHVIGIVAEYNPFHKGHEYLISKARELVGDPRAVVMSIMSGPFTQRGLPAIAPKHVRAKQALKCGSDVVIELPFEWACAPANEFAYGAVYSLLATGVVTDIAFGIDAGTPEVIRSLSDPALYESDDYKTALKACLADGMSFPSANAAAISGILGPSVLEVLHSPNSILAVEYLKAMRTLGANFKVHMIPRIGQGYRDTDQEEDTILSASSVRSAIGRSISVAAIADAVNGKLPDKSSAVLLSSLSGGAYHLADLDAYAVRAVTSGPASSDIRFMGDGLDGYINNVTSELRSSEMSFEEMSSKLATKHFTMPRIYRALTMMMLGVKSSDISGSPEYIRVLGFGHEGRYCLKIMGKCAKLPIIHNMSDFLSYPDIAGSMELSVRAEDLAGIFMGIPPHSCWDVPPVIVK